MMIMRIALILLIASSIAACTGAGSVQPVYSSAAVQGQQDSGIGGTGFSEISGGDEGVGGTGFGHAPGQGSSSYDAGRRSTGIIGIITGLGRLLVGGLQVDYDPEVPVAIDGDRGTSADLAIGQLVAVESDELSGSYRARRVEIRHAVVGPVTSVDLQSRYVLVLGQHVRIPEGEVLPEAGDWIKVSGLRSSDGTIDGSRIEPVSPSADMMVRGDVSLGRQGQLTIGSLSLAPSDALIYVEDGDELIIRGYIEAGMFHLHSGVIEDKTPFGGRVERIVIEGYVSDNGDGDSVLSGYPWLLKGHASELTHGRLFRIDGSVDGSDIFVEQSVDLMNGDLRDILSSQQTSSGSQGYMYPGAHRGRSAVDGREIMDRVKDELDRAEDDHRYPRRDDVFIGR